MQRFLRRLILASLPLSATAWAAALAPVSSAGANVAFARYLDSVEQQTRNNAPAATQVEIEASLPKLEKHGRLRAVRHQAPLGPVYEVTQVEGDTTVKQQVIARYLATETQAADISPSTVAISPLNYRFRYAGSIETAGKFVYVYDITPRKKRPGLIEGQLWIDGSSGLAVRQAGRLVKRPSVFVRRVDITRDTEQLANGLFHRVTHLDIDTRLVGHAQLTIEEQEQ